MSVNEEVMRAYEAELLERYDEFDQKVEYLRRIARETATCGANLGAVVVEAEKQHREKLWVWLRNLRADIREDVIKMALRAHAVQRRDPDLDSTGQLAFCLADPDEGRTAGGDAKPELHQADPFAIFNQSVLKTGQTLRSFVTVYPPQKWGDDTRAQVRELLRPILDLAREAGVMV